MGGIDFYYMPPSGACRSVHMLARYLNVPLNLKVVDLMKGEQLAPEFLKINPTHTIPTIVEEDGFTVYESRPILEYLAEKYGDGKVLPTELKAKTEVKILLSFDATGLSKVISEFFYPQVMEKASPDAEKKKKMEDKFTLLETLLKGPYFTGENLTIADFAILSSLTTLEAVDYDISAFPKLQGWIEKLKSEFSFYNETNGLGIELMKKFVKGEQ